MHPTRSSMFGENQVLPCPTKPGQNPATAPTFCFTSARPAAPTSMK